MGLLDLVGAGSEQNPEDHGTSGEKRNPPPGGLQRPERVIIETRNNFPITIRVKWFCG